MENVRELLELLEASKVGMEVNIIDEEGARLCSLEINPQSRTIRIKRANVIKLLRNVKLIKLLLKVRKLMKKKSAGGYSIKVECSLLRDIFSSKKPPSKNGKK